MTDEASDVIGEQHSLHKPPIAMRGRGERKLFFLVFLEGESNNGESNRYSIHIWSAKLYIIDRTKSLYRISKRAYIRDKQNDENV